jgi:2,6-dihydroxypyridine 3-monooxygenase
MAGLGMRDDGATVRFESGRMVDAELVVCADGISSTARSLLSPGIEPQYAGYIGWRGLAPEADVSPETFATLLDALTYAGIPNSHIVLYACPNPDGPSAPAPGNRMVNWVWYRNVDPADLPALMTDKAGYTHAISLPAGGVQDRFVDELKRHAGRDWAPFLAEVVQQTPQPFIQVLIDHAVPRMVHRRAVLMGDAAFAARPHAAAGTAKAAEDAWRLADALVATGFDVDRALQQWEPGQLELGRSVIARNQAIGTRYQVTGEWEPGEPFLQFGLYGPGQ